MQYIINYTFKTSELKNDGEANSSSLNALLEQTGNLHFCTFCEIIFLVGGPGKVLEKWLKCFV